MGVFGFVSMKFSVIVPIYHVLDYIHECLTSIISQSPCEYEALLIDDGGDDACPEICDEYAFGHEELTCIHKPNQGQSFARRDALIVADGDYIMYVDGDDWIDKKTLKKSEGIIRQYDPDILMFGYNKAYRSCTVPAPIFATDESVLICNPEELRRRMVGPIGIELSRIEDIDRPVTMWGKVYRRGIAEDGLWISERETGSLEDAVYNLGAFANCGKCVYFNENLYFYRHGNCTSTTTAYRPRLAEQWQNLYRFFSEYIAENSLPGEYSVALRNRMATGILGIGLNEMTGTNRIIKTSCFLKKYIRTMQQQGAFQNFDFSYCALKWKIFYFCCKHSLTFSVAIMLSVIQRILSHRNHQ